MTQRTKSWLVVFVLADLIAWILTLRAHFTFHHTKNGPTVMSVGQLLGWFLSVSLLILIVIIVAESRRSRRR